MKIEAKGYGRNRKRDVREHCGRLTFIAQDEVDAIELASLYLQWTSGGNNRVNQLRREALLRYCRENNVSIVIE
jgi:hypothetical protein